jgi:hypothetical protein
MYTKANTELTPVSLRRRIEERAKNLFIGQLHAVVEVSVGPLPMESDANEAALTDEIGKGYWSDAAIEHAARAIALLTAKKLLSDVGR